MLIVAPSILSADFGRMAEEIAAVERGGAEYLHIDVMDGLFVPSISFGMPVIRSLRKETKLFFDVHLMIVDPLRYIDAFAEAGADGITFHLEAAEDPDAVIRAIREKKLQVGISIKPGTPFAQVAPYMDKVDMLLIMTVEPGFGGQAYLEATTEKIREARDFVDVHGLRTLLEVDGGINETTFATALEAGAEIFVAGSAVFKGNAEENTRRLLALGMQR